MLSLLSRTSILILVDWLGVEERIVIVGGQCSNVPVLIFDFLELVQRQVVVQDAIDRPDSQLDPKLLFFLGF